MASRSSRASIGTSSTRFNWTISTGWSATNRMLSRAAFSSAISATRAAQDYRSEGAPLPHPDAQLLQQFQHREKGDDHILDATAVLEQAIERHRARAGQTALDHGNAIGLRHS